MKQIKELEREIKIIGNAANIRRFEEKIKTLKEVLALIKVKMTHENRNFVLDALSDLCGEIEGK